MTREVVGLVVLDAIFLALGLGVLCGLGVVRSVGESVRFAGLALVLGWAVTGISLSLALALGAPFRAYVVIALWAAVGAVSAAGARRSAPSQWPPLQAGSGAARLVARGAAGLVVLYVASLLVRSAYFDGGFHPDVWSFWLPKAKVIFFFHGLASGSGELTSQVSPDYPPLDPILDAVSFRAMGRADVLMLPVQHTVVAAAFLGGIAALLARRVRPALLFPGLAAVALMPGWSRLAGSCLADEALSLMVATAAVAGVLWLLEPRAWLLVLCGLFLVAATLTKNEGVMLAAAFALGLAVASRRARVAAALLGPALASLAVWRVWLRVHDVPPNAAYRLSNVLHPAYLVHHLDRLAYGLGQLVTHLASVSNWLFLTPLALVAAAFLGRAGARLLVTMVLTIGLGICGFAAIYWTSSLELHYYVDNSVGRIVSSLAVLGASLFPLVVAEGLAAGRPSAALSAGNG